MPEPVRPAEAGDLDAWDDRAVEVPAGHVYQSRAWARHRERQGWVPRFLVAGDQPVLALLRPWRGIGGGSAYISRGPIPSGEAATTATTLTTVAGWLGENGTDVVAADPEVAAGSDFAERIRGEGFRQIEELQPSRHRLDVALPASDDSAGLLASFSSTTRNLIRQAERQELVTRRIDRRREELETTPLVPQPEETARLDGLYTILRETAERRAFAIGPKSTFLSWTTEALEAGHLFAVLIEAPDGNTVAGATFYRHGDRVTYALSGERADARKAHPGAARLLLWRAMEVAMSEHRATFDLGGVDVRGARRKPVKGEPEHGMLQFKESLGGQWVELAGAHELGIRPRRYLAGRILDRIARR